MQAKRVVVIDVVGLSLAHFEFKESMPHIASLLDQGRLFDMQPVFPPVTLPVQASLTTGVYPEKHGVVANGFYFPENFQVAFWEQAAGLVRTERIWDRLKRKNPELKTAALFFQNTLYAQCDAIITPRPMHTEEGLVQWCYSKPVGYYEEVSQQIGDFNLFSFWGPFASIESSRWIAQAAVETMARIRPNLLYVYLPHLDYPCQIHGPANQKILAELSQVDREVGRIVGGIANLGLGHETLYIVLSEYAFSEVQGDIPLNRLLKESGLLKVRTIQGREYLDFELSPAFAMVDHQIAHIYVKSGKEKEVRKALEKIDGIDFLLGFEDKTAYHIGHPRAGDIIAVSARDRWFSYYWWDERAKEPDFAAHVDIHRKPGYDPMELFLEPETFKVSQDTNLIRGSHGYPALSRQDQVVFLISGERQNTVAVPETLCVTEIAAIIEKDLIQEH